MLTVMCSMLMVIRYGVKCDSLVVVSSSLKIVMGIVDGCLLCGVRKMFGEKLLWCSRND